jgi:hypothetical protein
MLREDNYSDTEEGCNAEKVGLTDRIASNGSVTHLFASNVVAAGLLPKLVSFSCALDIEKTLHNFK